MTKEHPYPFHLQPRATPMVLVTVDFLVHMRDETRRQMAEIRRRAANSEIIIDAALAQRMRDLIRTERQLSQVTP